MTVELGRSGAGVSSTPALSDPATLVRPGWSAASTEASNAADAPPGNADVTLAPVVANFSARPGTVTCAVTIWISLRSGSGSASSVVAGVTAPPPLSWTPETEPGARCWTTWANS